MRKRKNPMIVANEFINLTALPLYVYDDSTGGILIFPPIVDASRAIANAGPDDYYVINEAASKIVDECKLPRKKLCAVHYLSQGRNNVNIARIALADNQEQYVCVRCYEGKNGLATDY
jgi:hypothetical protein